MSNDILHWCKHFRSVIGSSGHRTVDLTLSRSLLYQLCYWSTVNTDWKIGVCSWPECCEPMKLLRTVSHIIIWRLNYFIFFLINKSSFISFYFIFSLKLHVNIQWRHTKRLLYRLVQTKLKSTRTFFFVTPLWFTYKVKRRVSFFSKNFNAYLRPVHSNDHL